MQMQMQMSRANRAEKMMMSKKIAAASHTQSKDNRATVAAPLARTATPGRMIGIGHQALAAMLLATFLIGSGYFGMADALKCHLCGQYNEGVGSITPCQNYSKEIGHLYLKECTKKTEKFCVKYVSELSTVRDCATKCDEKDIWGTQTYCCNEDGCNSGSHLGYSAILLAVPLFCVIWSACCSLLKVRR